MDIKELALKYNDYIVDQRRYFHSCPEFSNQEFETAAAIRREFVEMGFTDIKDLSTKNGFVAKLHGGKPGKCIGLRSDIDALSVKEETGLPFASKFEGKMHACGHDNHIAMLLGAAKILTEIKDELEGDVLFIVQPAEEVATGALQLVNEGLVDDCDGFYGAHVWGTFPQGLIDATAGNRMACCHGFKIAVEGLSAHGSAPHLGVDAIAISAAIVKNLQQVCSRQNDPLNPMVITIGEINGGSRNNIICNHVEMTGTCRTFLMGTEVEDKMRKIIEGTASALGGSAKLYDYIYMTVPVINDAKMVSYASDAIKTVCGEEAIGHIPTMTGAEDFSWLGVKMNKPYFYTFIGTKNTEKGYTYTNHQEKYDVDEDILHNGAAVMAQFAVNFLKNEK